MLCRSRPVCVRRMYFRNHTHGLPNWSDTSALDVFCEIRSQAKWDLGMKVLDVDLISGRPERVRRVLHAKTKPTHTLLKARDSLQWAGGGVIVYQVVSLRTESQISMFI